MTPLTTGQEYEHLPSLQSTLRVLLRHNTFACAMMVCSCVHALENTNNCVNKLDGERTRNQINELIMLTPRVNFRC